MIPFFKSIQQDELLALGLMSGSSCDGLDVALVRFTPGEPYPAIDFLAGQTFPYTDEQRDGLLEVIRGRNNSQTLSQLNFYLAQIWADSVLRFVREQNLQPEQIAFIGSHGQTMWHQPQQEQFIDRSVRSTMQLGDPAVLAQLSGIIVVGDFRVADMAAGGQGAPLIPLLDLAFFGPLKQNLLVVNIGGIANFTFVPANGDPDLLRAFDTGPGNMLIDGAMQKLYGRAMDANGNTARSGKVDRQMLNFLQESDRFPFQPPPKSTGRERYSAQFLDRLFDQKRKWQIPDADFICTLTEYTARTIHENAAAFLEHYRGIKEVTVGGGGSRNGFLMHRLQHHFKEARVTAVSAYSMPEDFKEAIGFALLACQTMSGRPGNVPPATGAGRPVVLGKICLP